MFLKILWGIWLTLLTFRRISPLQSKQPSKVRCLFSYAFVFSFAQGFPCLFALITKSGSKSCVRVWREWAVARERSSCSSQCKVQRTPRVWRAGALEERAAVDKVGNEHLSDVYNLLMMMMTGWCPTALAGGQGLPARGVWRKIKATGGVQVVVKKKRK